jgi:hypothetical protein
MTRLPHCALVRSYVLNSLENGPARVADLVQRGRAEFGFSHREVEAAAKHFAVITRRGRYIGGAPPICLPFGGGFGPNPKLVRDVGTESTSQSVNQTNGAESNCDLRTWQ